MRKMIAIFIAAVTSAYSAGAAQAQTPAAQYHIELGPSGFNGIYDQPGTYSGNGGHEQITVASTPSPYIDAYGYFPTDGGGGSDGTSASLLYYIFLSGPDSSVPVPVDVSYTLQGYAISPSGTYGDSRTSIGLSVNDQSYSESRVTQDGSYDVSSVWNVSWLPNSGGLVQMTAYASAYACSCDGLAPTSARAYVDPVFTIDPTFAASHPGYSLSFSPGIGNDPITGGVPEPETWAMLMLGMGLVGAAMRRRGQAPRRA